MWWISYWRIGKGYNESSRSDKKGTAEKLLKSREGDIVHGKPVTPQMARLSFADAAADLLTDYRTNGRRSLAVLERRVRKHLTPFFERYRMGDITTSHVRRYIDQRQTEPSVLVRSFSGTDLHDAARRLDAAVGAGR